MKDEKQMQASPSTISSRDSVLWLYSRGSDGFLADQAWRENLDRKGIRCPECDWLREGGIDRLDALVVDYLPEKRVLGGVSCLHGGLVMRSDLIKAIGTKRLDSLCHFRPVFLADGTELNEFTYLVERDCRGCFRGQRDSEVSLCNECGRLCYWPRAYEKWYLLRSYWDGADGATVLEGHLICTPSYFQTVLLPHQFPRLTYKTFRFADAPNDDLPVSVEEMKAEVRRRGWVG
jgi:hypothetical protein